MLSQQKKKQACAFLCNERPNFAAISSLCLNKQVYMAIPDCCIQPAHRQYKCGRNNGKMELSFLFKNLRRAFGMHAKDNEMGQKISQKNFYERYEARLRKRRPHEECPPTLLALQIFKQYTNVLRFACKQRQYSPCVQAWRTQKVIRLTISILISIHPSWLMNPYSLSCIVLNVPRA